jgi:hypothetical protein
VVAITGDLDEAIIEALRLIRARCLVTVVTTRPVDASTPRSELGVIDASGDFAHAWNTLASRQVRRWNATTSPLSSLSAR